jgi:hypothetical protein
VGALEEEEDGEQALMTAAAIYSGATGGSVRPDPRFGTKVNRRY